MINDDVVIKWIPPSWVQIKAKGKVIYVDPVFLQQYHTETPENFLKQMEPADIILMTHHHFDHCDLKSVIFLRHSGTTVIGTKLCEKELGFKIKTIKPGEEMDISGVSIKAVHAYNTSQGSSTNIFHKKSECLGYIISVSGKTIYHAGDTDLIPEMKQFGKIDVALLPMGGTYTMNIDEAIQAVIDINPGLTIPIHHLQSDPNDFKRKLEGKSMTKVVLLKKGESITV